MSKTNPINALREAFTKGYDWRHCEYDTVKNGLDKYYPLPKEYKVQFKFKGQFVVEYQVGNHEPWIVNDSGAEVRFVHWREIFKFYPYLPPQAFVTIGNLVCEVEADIHKGIL